MKIQSQARFPRAHNKFGAYVALIPQEDLPPGEHARSLAPYLPLRDPYVAESHPTHQLRDVRDLVFGEARREREAFCRMHAQAYHHQPAFAHDATHLSQVEFRVGPELIVVDRQNSGKTPALIRQICDRSLADLGAARHDQVEVVFRRLANHDIRQINARDETGFGAFGYYSNRSTVAEADLQRLLVRLDVEHFDGEFVHPGVLDRHQSSDAAAKQSRRTGELRRQARSFASSRRRGLDQRLVEVDLSVHRRLLHFRFSVIVSSVHSRNTRALSAMFQPPGASLYRSRPDRPC